MKENNKRIITVLFTRYSDRISNLIYYITGRGYTHASLSLDEREDCYYSFNFKGFRMEHPQKHKNRCGNSIAYRLEVTNQEYEEIKNRIDDMVKEKDRFGYSCFGAFMSIIGIPFKKENRYFCSQFVAELLQQTKSICLNKKASLYMPNDLSLALRNQSCLRNIIYNPI